MKFIRAFLIASLALVSADTIRPGGFVSSALAQTSGGITRSGAINPGDLAQFKNGSQIQKVTGVPLNTQCLVYTGTYPNGTWGAGACAPGGGVTSVTLTAGAGLSLTGTCTSVSIISCTFALNPLASVTSFNGRFGTVVPATNDYAFSNISGTLGCSQLPAFTTDITNAACVLTIANSAITNAKMANMAANTVKGSIAGGVPADLTTAQLTTLCNLATVSLKGCAPVLSNVATQFLAGDGVYRTPALVSSVTLGQGVTGASNPIVATGDVRLDPAYMAGFLTGCGFQNNATDALNDVDIALPCGGTDSLNAVWIRLTTALTKQKDVNWAVGGTSGTPAGCWDNSGVPHAVGVTVHYWIIRRSDTGVTDVLCSASATAPTMPSPYDSKRYVNSLPTLTAASASLAGFIQDGNDFSLKIPVVDVNITNPTTAAVTRQLVSLPQGVRVRASISVGALNAIDGTNVGIGTLVTDLATTATTPTSTVSNVAITSILSNNVLVKSMMEVYTNTSAQVRTQVSVSSANYTMYITSIGWKNTRGQ